jgi:hypothetical protein
VSSFGGAGEEDENIKMMFLGFIFVAVLELYNLSFLLIFFFLELFFLRTSEPLFRSCDPALGKVPFEMYH